jgi:hypothetical protein
MNKVVFVVFVSFSILFSCSSDNSTGPSTGPSTGIVDCTAPAPKFGADVNPIIQTSCALSGCHDSGSRDGDYTSYAGVKNAADNGRLRSQIISGSMPPSNTKGPKTLSQREIQQVICWIGEGAKND